MSSRYLMEEMLANKAKQGRVVAVAGVGPGLGAAVCRRFAREGFKVAMLSRSADKKLARLSAELSKAGAPEVMAVPCDVCEEDSVKRAFAQIKMKLGEVTVLVYNAGGFTRGGICDLKAEEFEAAFRSNCTGGLLTMQQVLPSMAARGHGTVIFTGATASTRGARGFAGFATGKMALRGLAQSAAREYGPQGVHVAHVIVDGMINEPKVRKMFPDVPVESLIDPKAIADTYFHLHAQDQTCFTFELEVRPAGEKW